MSYIFDQGHFDGMCGNYSIINSISYTTGLGRKKCGDIFREIFEIASELRPEFVINGLYFSDMEQIVRNINVPGLKITMPFRSMVFDTIGDFYGSLAKRINNKPTCAIIGLGAPVHHWTVADHIHPRSISLIDSGGRKHIKLANAGFLCEKRKVRIHPRQTIFFKRAI